MCKDLRKGAFMKTANASLRHMTLAMLLTGVVGTAWAVGPTSPVSPIAALNAAAGVPPAASPAVAASDAPAVAPVQALSGSDDDRAETTLKKASALQAKYVLRKIQSDIDKLDATPSGGMGAAPTQFPSSNPLDALRAANGTPTPLAQKVESKPAAAPAPVSTMKVVGTYGAGDSAYADMIVDDAHLVATRGTMLTNGYHVDAITASGVDLSKGRKHTSLPVVQGSLQSMASGGSMVPGTTGGSGMGSVPDGVSRYTQLTGPGVTNSTPPGLGQPMIIPAQPIGPTGGGLR